MRAASPWNPRFLAGLSLMALLSLSALSARADVFSLFPLSHAGGGGSGEAMEAKLLWSEPVTINGIDASLGISILDIGIDECAAKLKKAYPNGKSARSRDSIVFETTAGKGLKERLFFVAMPGIYPIMQFSMKVPDSLSTSKPQWPASMPLPSSSKPISVMSFPKRNSDYGLFSSDMPSSQCLQEISSAFKSNGWMRMDEEPASARSSGNGGVYLSSDSTKIAIASVSDSPDGGSKGAIYMRPLK